VTTKRAIVKHRGCNLNYSVTGKGAPVVLIQGAGVCGSGWMPQVEALSSEYSCLTFDNRGVGNSVPTSCPLTIEQMAEDTLALMDAEGWVSAHIVGHSLGGLVAEQIALSGRSRVRSLTLMCTFSRGSDATKMSLFVMWAGLRSRIGTRKQRRRAFLELSMPAEYLQGADMTTLAQRLAPIYGHDLADSPSITTKQLMVARRFDATPKLAELSGISTLVITAAHDRIARPEYGRAIAAAIEGARYVEVPDAAHGLPLQEPDLITYLLRDHFQPQRTEAAAI
jgi:pimeloyl-ACP methyl ester carboxylesterase